MTYASSADAIRSTFQRVCVQQNKYWRTRFTANEVLDDVITTSLLICSIDLKGHAETPQTAELRAGIRSIHSYLVTTRFSFPEAKLAASRAAFIATVLKKREAKEDLKHFRFSPERIDEIRDEQLGGNLLFLNKLKRTNPEAFYYLINA